MEEKFRQPFHSGLKEYKEFLHMSSDSAAGQMNLGNFYTRLNDKENAKGAFRKAVKIDNYFNMARMNLAYMLSIDGKYDEAEKIYLKVIEQEPSFGPAWMNLGLLYSEMKNYGKAEEAFDIHHQEPGWLDSWTHAP